ncbi:MAG: polyhydroxyalkanoate synthesis regulator DNA-binding domain-containing protein [Desulfobacterales bacterium]|nr:polyhydroxyalkanoate synthesis regulator DNA-binding domain-containing protein [Desulfobacterales bacterium]MDJ0853931.1 polyhydroxyalkanoate synthesis regulator DNA-binding domain-containing protein [Desulfobacterales bacterium]MDJ0887102.1 polyhydroxyalkanoate synthesis regulator DNA-binding domain-containing protein [Desulfobacterales bacterium]MDJ0989128.1 polyhydroxyalkanoate synthesis regulator DNA-binding domain-containing protein [Desulfobacterales bacterium]
MEGPRVYKKYANRRIYDTFASGYVTLEELAEVVRQGGEVKVIDAKTKEDVTAFILTQIVLEQAKRKNALLPSPVLHLIIQYGDNVLLEFFETYLQQIARNYIRYKKTVDDQFKRWLDLGMGLSRAGGRGRTSEINPFAAFWGPGADADKPNDE